MYGKARLVRRRGIVVSLGLALVAAGCGRRRRGSYSGGGGHHPDEGPGEVESNPPPAEAPGDHADPDDIAAEVLRSVVSVRVRGRGAGSGFAIDSDGHILTNAHIVKGAKAVAVKLHDGRTVDATIVGTREAADIAVLRAPAARVPAAELGRSSDLRVGDLALTVGSPHELSGTVATGIVSALKRSVALTRSGPEQELIQTDAAVNSGNTGGPLVDGRGQVVGVNTVTATPAESRGDSEGIGFAIPIERALDIASDLTD